MIYCCCIITMIGECHMNKLMLLHGTDHIIKKPSPEIGNEHNDYRRGFYCTTQPEIAKEWACKQNTDGFVNRYSF
ncbi:MAG: DUF3990 domain-containing protein, partial [Oscillospiraceae bacterium]